MSHPRIAFIGAGNMAASLIGGLLAQGIPASHIRASDPGAEQRAKIAGEHGIALFADNAEAILDADVIVLATKPQVLKDVCLALAPSLQDGQLLVSIAAGIPTTTPWAHVSNPSLLALATQLTAAEFKVDGKSMFKDEFVTCGGVKLSEVDFKTMESRKIPGLHFAGEVLDIDGVCATCGGGGGRGRGPTCPGSPSPDGRGRRSGGHERGE